MGFLGRRVKQEPTGDVTVVDPDGKVGDGPIMIKHQDTKRRNRRAEKKIKKDPFLSSVYDQLKKARTLGDLLDILLDLPQKNIDRRLQKLVEKYPHMTTQGMMEELKKDYVRQSGLSSAAVGAGAAYPGVGTAVAAGLTGAELIMFGAESVYYILSVATLTGVHVDDKERRRTLVVSSLMGEEGARLVSDQLGIRTLQWARNTLSNLNSPTLKAVNKMLMDYAQKKVARKLSTNVLGKLIPFGIGAIVGWFSGRKIARNVVEGSGLALGAPDDEPAGVALARIRAHNELVTEE